MDPAGPLCSCRHRGSGSSSWHVSHSYLFSPPTEKLFKPEIDRPTLQNLPGALCLPQEKGRILTVACVVLKLCPSPNNLSSITLLLAQFQPHRPPPKSPSFWSVTLPHTFVLSAPFAQNAPQMPAGLPPSLPLGVCPVSPQQRGLSRLPDVQLQPHSHSVPPILLNWLSFPTSTYHLRIYISLSSLLH